MVWASHLKPYMINIFEQRVQHLGVNNDFFFNFMNITVFICLISLVKGTEADHDHYYHFSNSSNNNIINIQGKQIDTKELHLKCYYLQ